MCSDLRRGVDLATWFFAVSRETDTGMILRAVLIAERSKTRESKRGNRTTRVKENVRLRSSLKMTPGFPFLALLKPLRKFQSLSSWSFFVFHSAFL